MVKAFILYHPNSENARTIEQYTHDFESVHYAEIDKMSLETKEGAALATLYDITTYPALLVLRDDSRQLVKAWQGLPMPLMDELAGYMRA